MKIALLLVFATLLALISISFANTHQSQSLHEKSHGKFIGHRAGRLGDENGNHIHSQYLNKPIRRSDQEGEHHVTSKKHGKNQHVSTDDVNNTHDTRQNNQHFKDEHKQVEKKDKSEGHESAEKHQGHKNDHKGTDHHHAGVSHESHTKSHENTNLAGKQKTTHTNKGVKKPHNKDANKHFSSFFSNKQKIGEFKLVGNKNKRYHMRQDKDRNGKYLAKKPFSKYSKIGVQHKPSKRTKAVKKNSKSHLANAHL